MKMFLLSMIFFFAQANISLSDNLTEEKDFTIKAQIGFLPPITAMEIKTYLEIKDNKYEYLFQISTKQLIKFINEVNGKGQVKGIIDNGYKPIEYTYAYKRKNKDKYVNIKYLENRITKLTVKPDFDKTQLSPLSDDMLINTIDPSTFFLSLLNYNNIDECKKSFKIFDGKRRYDVIFKEKLINEDTNIIECTAEQIKIGGYKEKESDVFASSEYIKIMYSLNGKNFAGYEAGNGALKIYINEKN